jgi:hypothetical protein
MSNLCWLRYVFSKLPQPPDDPEIDDLPPRQNSANLNCASSWLLRAIKRAVECVL